MGFSRSELDVKIMSHVRFKEKKNTEQTFDSLCVDRKTEKIQNAPESEMRVYRTSLLMFEIFLATVKELLWRVFPGDGEALQLSSRGPNWSLLHANLRVTSNNNRHSRNCLCLFVCFTWKRYLRSQNRSNVHSTRTFACTFLYGLNLIIKPMPLRWLASYTNYVPNTQWSLIERLYNNRKTKGIHRWIFMNKAGTSSYMNQFERLIDLKSQSSISNKHGMSGSISVLLLN